MVRGVGCRVVNERRVERVMTISRRESRELVARSKKTRYTMSCQCFAFEGVGARYDEICSGTEPR